MSTHAARLHGRRALAPTVLSASIAALLPLSAALAQDTLPVGAVATTDFDTIVVTAAGFEQKLTDAPASISVVTREELVTRPYITLIDAVRDLEGVDVGETSDKTGQKTISMRGMGPDYTLILVDGRRQNNHGDIYPNSFGGNQFNHIPPLDMIERIEVIRGPASTLYGADALGGVVNIITRKVGEHWRGSATVSRNVQENDDFGTDSTFDFALSGPLVRDRLGLGVRGSWYERDASTPDYEVISAPDGTQVERSLGFGGGGKTVDNTNRSAGLTLSWTPSEYQSLVFDYDTSKQEYDNTPYINNLGTETYPLGTVDGIEGLWRAAPRVGYASDQEFTRDQWALTWQGQWDWGNSFVSLAHIDTANHGRTLPFTVAERLLHQDMYCNNAATCGTGPYAGLTRAQRRQLVADTFLPRPGRTMDSSQYTLDAKFDFAVGERHHLVVGGQLIDGELEDGVFGMEDGGDGGGTVQEHRMWSLFAEDNWNPVDALTITLGLRHDDHNVFGSHLSPRAYAVWDVSPAWTLKGGISTGYKTPKTTDLYDGVTGFGGQGTSPFVGNPDLEPETSVNSEVALYWTSPDSRHNFNVTVFRNDFDDKIARGETSLSCAQTGGVRPCANLGDYGLLGYTTYAQNINIDEVRVQGAELAGRWGITEAVSLRANYTYTDSEQLSGPQQGLPLTDTAKHMANATLGWQASERFSMQLVSEIRSARYRDVFDGVRRDYEDYTVFHLGAQYRFSDRVAVNARINNLLDQDFTSFETLWTQDAGTGEWLPTYLDDYNNKDKARNLWVSLNVQF
ncbi:TonB-dependent receptor [Luteimonas sp. MC1750]|uniref:TonB-dependent receptor domain-containing protein n=1 Tax=Luteimonas sp. MC1750 TaxID=2799326 RepID=UPI0018F0B152|nr:TonB-dependent receptor [Luteimonas sp. MC1750]MBJ6983623.1 TonB-dependent receptor [Luteimonas sp. MC1750]QQO06466.1 TonB-dependent receptor [Luteimonas sp. MC1750]